MTLLPRPQEIYRHFKGNLYQIVTLAEHSETGERLVIYQALYGDYKVYARELDSFTSAVDRVKYPDVAQQLRFEKVEPAAKEPAECPEEFALDPLVVEFLDADSYAQRLNILAALHHRITDEMVTTMAVSCDIEVGDGDVEERYAALKNCLITLEKYECNRLR